MSAARPLARATTAVERALRLIVWGVQLSTAAVYLTTTAQPDAWRHLLAADRSDAIFGAATLLVLTFLWGVSLYAEQTRFYDTSARRAHRKFGLLAHAGVLVFALGVAADQHQQVALWALPVLCTLPAAITWHAWMRSFALPPEDQAVVDAVLDRKAQEAAARLEADCKELRRERLDAIVTRLGYQDGVGVNEETKATKGVEDAARPWQIPPRKHRPLVYFLRNGNRIKIGTTTELKRRIRTLALRPENLVLLLDGGRQLERDLHSRFAGLRIGNSEWFAYDGPLIDFVHAENTRAARTGEQK